MANAMLYYRTQASTAIITPDPDNLPSAQKLLFSVPDDIMAGIEETWANNNVKRIPPASRGKKRLQTDEGKGPWIVTISGNYITTSGDSADKIDAFRNLSQDDDYHIHGVFGIKYPNGPAYLTQDATNLKGWMIDSMFGKHVGTTKEIFDFGIILSFGGTR
jgi:hypothetical protein